MQGRQEGLSAGYMGRALGPRGLSQVSGSRLPGGWHVLPALPEAGWLLHVAGEPDPVCESFSGTGALDSLS